MKKLLFLLFIANMMLFTSCSSSDSNDETQTKEEILQKGIVGSWLSSDDNYIYLLSLKLDGTGTLNIMEYSNNSWSESEQTLLYTLSGDKATIKAVNGDTWSGTVAITGTSMSLTDNDESTILTKYNGNESQINELKKDIEENFLDVTPTDSISQESFFVTESNIRNYVAGLYLYMAKFQLDKLQLECIRTTGKDLDGKTQIISASSNMINQAWKSAYKTISYANTGINGIDKSKYPIYYNEAIVLRDWVYLNIYQLWGKVCIVNPNDIFTVNVYDATTIIPMIEQELKGIDKLNEEDNHFNFAALKALRAEIALHSGKHAEALTLLDNLTCNFDMLYTSEALDYNVPTILNNKISIYSQDRIALMKKEASDDTSTLVTSWQTFGSDNYGYWAMLIRTNQAVTVTGCKSYEVLMPFPISELASNPILTQNPGY